MGFVEKLTGAGGDDAAAPQQQNTPAVVDGALDTLGCILRTMGEAAFATDKEPDPDEFFDRCVAHARHVENGASVPAAGIVTLPDGGRDWSQVRRFYVDRRHDERDFVNRQLGDYRAIVDDLVDGLRRVADRDQLTEDSIIECLASIQEAIETGGMPDVKAAVSQAVENVHETFARQKREYERQIEELNQRMSSLRQDLLAAREEMKRDNLTDVFNRGAFDTGIEQCINLHFVSGQPVTLVLVDLDNFKTVNERFGHATGDAALRAVGETLSRSFIRKNDLVCRYGGDEFAVILNDTTAASAAPLLERFLERVREIEMPGVDEPAAVSCSVGYAEIAPNDDSAALIDRADKALYAAKAAGRDRMVLGVDDE